MKKNNEVSKKVIREYDTLESVPVEGRHIGFGGMCSTWAGMAIQPGTWLYGGMLLLAGVGLGVATSFVGSLLIFILIGCFGLISYTSGFGCMATTRFTLGIRGSKIVTIASIISYLGWVMVCGYLAATPIAYWASVTFDTAPDSKVVMIIGALIAVLLSFLCVGIGGSKTLKVFQALMMLALIICSIIIFVVVGDLITWQDIINLEIPAEQKTTVIRALDTLLALLIPMCIIAGDTSRYAKNKKTVIFAPALGGVFSIVLFTLMALLGIVAIYVSTGVFDINNSNPSNLVINLGLGVVALIVVMFSVVTTCMLNVYVLISSAQNIFTKWSYKKASAIVLIVMLAVCWIPCIFDSFIGFFYAFSDVLGTVFPPIFVLMIMDYFLVYKKKYQIEEINKENGAYWFKNGYNISAIFAWVIGSAVYLFMTSIDFAAADYISKIFLSLIITAVVYYIVLRVTGRLAKKQELAACYGETVEEDV